MKLRAENQRIQIDGREMVRVLQELELILVSLHNIGSYYATATDRPSVTSVDAPPSAATSGGYEIETTRFVDEWKVTHRLAEVRSALSKHFDSTPGEDELGDLERAMRGLDCWVNPGSFPRA